MRKILLSLSIIGTMAGFGQIALQKPGFNANAALLEAQQRHLSPKDYNGYVELKRKEWLKKNFHLDNATSPVSINHPQKRATTTSGAVNIDFETGNYGGWQLMSGLNDVNSFGPLSNILPASAGLIDDPANDCSPVERQAIMTSSASVDPICLSPLNSPIGGNYIARLNRFCTMMEGSILEQTFTVDSVSSILNYAYLTILEDGGHQQGEQAYFSAVVLDQNGDTIPNSFVYMQAQNGTTPGFLPTSNTFVFYKPWTPVSVDLVAYRGQNITLRFTSAACIYSGHSGYGYVDAKMDSISYTPNVWPGDANYDLTCDLNDLFYIGWAYGANGTARSSASNNWVAQPSTNWGTNTAYGTEFKHADCNGDGTVDLADTAAIVLNYGLGHVFKQANTNNQQAVDQLSTVNRNLILNTAYNTISPNQTLQVSLSVPASSTPALDKLYGIGFRVNIPANYINTLNTTNYTGSFLGTNQSNMICLVKPNIAGGYIDYSLVRRDHQNSSAAGNLCSFDLAIKNFTTDGNGQISLTNIKALTYEGTQLNLGSNVLNLTFSTAPNGLNELTATSVKLYPNPANESLFLSIQGNPTFHYEVMDVLGKVILNNTYTTQGIDVSSLSKGSYILKATVNNQVITKRFIKG